METPPRTWRRPRGFDPCNVGSRNTSTDVEKTSGSCWRRSPRRKHLHGRGEDLDTTVDGNSLIETPPRTRRRPVRRRQIVEVFGNTSTDVEKTLSLFPQRITLKKHLHGRGEDPVVSGHTFPLWETPPRTWRRQGPLFYSYSTVRNTSTDVEKTISDPLSVVFDRKHLHGRGEDSKLLQLLNLLQETPPRTWRRLHRFPVIPDQTGNTSTDVEKTLLWVLDLVLLWKHLHGRGEDF